MKNNIGWILSIVLTLASIVAPTMAQDQKEISNAAISINLGAGEEGGAVARVVTRSSSDGGKTWNEQEMDVQDVMNNVTVVASDGKNVSVNGMKVDSEAHGMDARNFKLNQDNISKLVQRFKKANGKNGPNGFTFDPAKMLARRADRYKDQIGATDEEWTILKPLIVAILKKQDEIRRSITDVQRTGAIFMMGGADQQKDLPIGIRNLREKMKSKTEMKPKEAKARLEQFQAARATQDAELKKLREELRSILTVIQEVKLTVCGILG